MATIHVFRAKWAVVVLMVFSFANARWKRTYEQDEDKLEQWYLDLHPDVNNIVWPQVENLTQEVHRKICDKVFREIQPFVDQFIWVEELPSDPNALTTMVKQPVLLELKREMLSIPVVECVWNRNRTVATSIVAPQSTIWLTHANDSCVFTVGRDEHTELFHLQTGLHAVSYDKNVDQI